MKRLSIKTKITLWYTLIMVVMSALAFSVMFSLSTSILTRDTQRRLTQTVDEFVKRLEDDDGKVSGIPKFGFYEQGVHMMLYDSDKNLIGGYIPFEFENNIDFADESLQYETQDGDGFYIYIREIKQPSSSSLWAEGVISVEDEDFAIDAAAKLNIILSSILVIIAAVGGYIMINRVFVPVKKISSTAKKISESNDLSQRIKIGKGKDEIHSLANTFDEMLDKIEQTMKREKQFTSDASHELRTPVAVILSECEYMTDCAKTTDEFMESAQTVKKQAEKMSKLISQLLTISRMDRNAVQTNFEKIDVSELLTLACEEQREIHKENITLNTRIKPHVEAFADRSLLTRLCINLISNAYSYGKDGGSITVSLDEDSHLLTLSVADDGIGISQEDIPKIWERFYQADPSRTSNENGSVGLGLSMVRWIAQCHGGNVDVESELGKGSTFTFTMPKQLTIDN